MNQIDVRDKQVIISYSTLLEIVDSLNQLQIVIDEEIIKSQKLMIFWDEIEELKKRLLDFTKDVTTRSMGEKNE